MKTKNLFNSTKILTAIFILSTFFTLTNNLQAQMAVTDPLNTAQNTITAGSAPVAATAGTANVGINTAKLTWDVTGKNLLDTAAYMAAQNLLSQLTNNTIAWIRGGFHGSPSFAVDTNEIFTDIADSIAGGLVLSLRNIAVCEFTASYKDDLVNTVDLSAKKRPYIYNQRATCPFKEDYNFKASDFYSDFSKGGWELMGAALNDGGNPYGVQLITAQEQASREAKAIADKEKKLSWSGGFTDIIDATSCNYPADIFYYPDDFSSGGTGSMTQEEANKKNAELLSDPARAKALQEAYCKTTTPGKIVGDQLTKTLGVDMDRIGFADNMNKIISAFLDTLTTTAVRSVFGSDRSTAAGGRPPSSTTQTPPVVAVNTGIVTDVTSNSATLNGFITYAGYEAKVTAWFLFGNTEASVSASQVAGAAQPYKPIPTGGVIFPVSIPVNVVGQTFSYVVPNLLPDTTYWFTANVGTSQTGTPSNLYGVARSFRTLPLQQ
ncbi:MAG: hypothetical protein UW27_C0007G0023 [Parcubacteria group bacterium GW2011_GWA1_44_13]|uniref:Fibronectin type-III domain-containing protein n=1 Tax=Candidatus Nomurabacteria bacterium GW2011_GWB1_44_12 TaxID=1618748 RepID=A0A837IAF8_9BACT|nr:MAG: hypothetical protein UW17_C0006G0002 [Candidatus Nomurabacteria bacterium GW2011_GWD1_44_10]KKT36932.1 MAG: hypothetical protein UW25_C0004G0260 [Candidatus Nomurabacteria bacterium GW2011_GWB1_44_12]KKT37968.1 MAG: hypothetical protein UW27_C0007G0023 [Parcubacteria group bacterium GW2011_GWA1_44_13]KKT60832.1 MAG: hypothetical protein UW54_C0003G0010 [Parcubacteria group bacterium GW2011_GWC1_44_26]HBB44108.1 hypothetical protein [Candidatus Yonathbacteria bacterium]